MTPQPPRVLARLDERLRIVVLPDSTLMGVFVRRAGGRFQAAARRSVDGGVTWATLSGKDTPDR